VVHEWYTINPVVSIAEFAAISLKLSYLVADMKKVRSKVFDGSYFAG
jgi:hypothetical protein